MLVKDPALGDSEGQEGAHTCWFWARASVISAAGSSRVCCDQNRPLSSLHLHGDDPQPCERHPGLSCELWITRCPAVHQVRTLWCLTRQVTDLKIARLSWIVWVAPG